WKEYEEVLLLDFLANHVLTAGDGLNFNKTTFSQAATYVNSNGTPEQKQTCRDKNPDSCKNKWNSLKAPYHHVVCIKNGSGLTWSDTDGAGISPESQHVWDDIIKVTCPAVAPFCNKGFIHLLKIGSMFAGSKGG
ncbi:hypothetical protein BDR07DRAFT_1218992, partial [Suillus spraguei]